MDKTTIYIPKELHQALEDMSRQTGRPQAQLIREAIANFVSGQKRKLPSTIGMFEHGTVNSENFEDWLAKNWTRDW